MKNKNAVILTLLFMMTVGAVFADLLSEDFTDGIPESWTVINNDGDGKTFVSPGAYNIGGDDKKHASGMGCHDDYLITPALSLTNNNLVFKAGVESSNKPYSFEVMISSTGNNVEDFTIIPGQVYTDYAVSSWSEGEHTVNLSDYSGETVYIAFHVTYSSSSYYNFAIDDVSVEEILAYDLQLTKISDDKIIASGSSDVYLTEIKNKGISEDVFNLTAVSSSDWNVSIWNKDQTEEISSVSLEADASDSIIVKIDVPIEGVNNQDVDILTLYATSAGNPAVSDSVSYETSAIVPLSELPYEENFDSLEEGLPFGWTQVKNEGSTGWSLKVNSSYTDYAYSPEKCLYNYDSYSSEIDDWIFISPVSLEAGSNYKFSAMMKNNSGSSSVAVQIGYGASANPDEMIIAQDIPDYQGTDYNLVSALVNPETSGSYVFGIHLISNTTTWFGVDDVILEEAFANDIKMKNLSYEEDVYFENNQIELNADVYNNGSEIQNDVTVTFKYGENVIGTVNVDSVEPGETESISIEWSAVAGLETVLSAITQEDDNLDNDIATALIDVYREGWLAESFENEFPPLEWANTEIENSSWEKDTDSAVQGSSSAKIRSIYERRSYLAGKARLITPKLIINQDSEISFFASRHDTTNTLKIEYSSDKEMFTEIQEVNLTQEYEKYTVSLGDIPEGNYYISFLGETGTSYGQKINIDMVTGPEIYLPEDPIFEITPNISEKEFDPQNLDADPQSQSFVIRNSGSGSLEMDESDIALIGDDADQFVMEFDDIEFPVSLAYNETLPVTVKFMPSSLGQKNAVLNIQDNLERVIHTVNFSGLATPAVPVPVSPVNDTMNVPLDHVISWINGPETEFIDLYLDTVNPPVIKVLDRVAPQESFSAELEESTKYYWKVVNYASIEDSEYVRSSSVQIFETVLPENIIQAGNGNEVNKGLPVDPYYGYSYSQSIYLQSEINRESSVIEKIYYHYNGAHEFGDEIVLYMGHTDKTEFSSNSDWIPLSSMTQVYAEVYNVSATDGWYGIELDSPFVYNNTDNLVIAFDENTDGYHSSNDEFYCTSFETNRSLRYRDDNVNADPEYPENGALIKAVPNVRLEFGEMNNAPTIDFGDFNVVFNENTESETFNFSQYINDVDENDELILTAENSEHITASIDGFNVVFSASENWSGTETLTFTVDDQARKLRNKRSLKRAVASAELEVTVVHVNNAPTIDFGDLNVIFNENAESETFDFSQYINDVDENDELILTAENSEHITASIDGFNVVFSASENWSGTETLTFTVDDQARKLRNKRSLKRAVASAELEITVVHVNYVPQIELPANIDIAEDETLTVDFSQYINDANENDELILTVSGNTDINAQIEGLNVIFSAPENWNGTETLTFTVNDQFADTRNSRERVFRAAASDDVVINITPVNDAPVAESQIEEINVSEDFNSHTINLDTIFSDPDGDDLTYSAEFNEMEINVELEGNMLTIGSVADWNGTSHLTITAEDNRSEILRKARAQHDVRASVSLEIDLIVAPVNDAPIIESFIPEETNLEITEIGEYTFEVNVSDVDGDELDYVWTVNGENQNIPENSFSYNFDTAGTFVVKVEVSEQEYSVEQEWIVISTVQAADEIITPKVTQLLQNTPNPFNPTTSVRFDLAKDGKVKIEVYNVKGQLVKTLKDEVMNAGSHSVEWNGRADNGEKSASGVYFFRMTADNFESIKKALMLK